MNKNDIRRLAGLEVLTVSLKEAAEENEKNFGKGSADLTSVKTAVRKAITKLNHDSTQTRTPNLRKTYEKDADDYDTILGYINAGKRAQASKLWKAMDTTGRNTVFDELDSAQKTLVSSYFGAQLNEDGVMSTAVSANISTDQSSPDQSTSTNPMSDDAQSWMDKFKNSNGKEIRISISASPEFLDEIRDRLQNASPEEVQHFHIDGDEESDSESNEHDDGADELGLPPDTPEQKHIYTQQPPSAAESVVDAPVVETETPKVDVLDVAKQEPTTSDEDDETHPIPKKYRSDLKKTIEKLSDTAMLLRKAGDVDTANVYDNTVKSFEKIAELLSRNDEDSIKQAIVLTTSLSNIQQKDLPYGLWSFLTRGAKDTSLVKHFKQVKGK